jgi:hypothetical protein
VEKRPDRDLERHERRRSDPDEFWKDLGVDVEGMSPRAQAVTGIVPGGLILLAAALLILYTQFWWLIFVFGWAVFPAFGVFARGVAGLVDTSQGPSPKNGKERELLEALGRHGELTPTQAAMETSLSVAEADKMLSGLAEAGHLEVRARGGALLYALWDPEEKSEIEGLGGRA